jgi:L-threonylcarbamoyladenylate synthase
MRFVLAAGDEAAEAAGRCQACGCQMGFPASHRPPGLPADVAWLDFGENVPAQARRLYQALRRADDLGLQMPVAVMPADAGLGHALRDRLRRAAGLGDGGAQADSSQSTLEQRSDAER